MNIYYWSPYLSKVATAKAVINSAESIKYFSNKKINTLLINAAGEWNSEKKKFESYADLQERVGLKEPIKHISQRIMDEISGESRMNLFVKR